jgi:Protein of unknown function (DUF2778)
MNGLYVYSLMVAGSLLALVIPLFGQAEIAFLFGAFMLWAVIMTGLQKRVMVHGEDLTDAQPGFDPRTQQPAVNFRVNIRGGQRFGEVTAENYSPFQSSVLLAQQNRNPALPATPSANRVFLEKFFDTPQHSGQQPSPPALPYAAAAKQSADIAKETLISTNRAFISPKLISALAHRYDDVQDKYWWSILPIWENSGNTPTRDMTIWVNSWLDSNPIPADFHFPPLVTAPESDVLDNEPPMPQMSDTPGGPGSYGPWSQDQTATAGLDFNMPGPGGGTPTTTAAAWTAVYDISAHTVYLPDGTKLEAHSGRGGRLDDPRYVHEHMRGATPPNVYELALREKTFHGVQALRLKPVGGGNTFGRSGLLAHTYMLGPKGESNGCVVFKNYNAFLQAFQNGQVKRLIVVDNLKVRKGYELTLAQVSFAPLADVGPEQSLAPSPTRGAELYYENQDNRAAGQEAVR